MIMYANTLLVYMVSFPTIREQNIFLVIFGIISITLKTKCSRNVCLTGLINSSFFSFYSHCHQFINHLLYPRYWEYNKLLNLVLNFYPFNKYVNTYMPGAENGQEIWAKNKEQGLKDLTVWPRQVN